MKSLSRHAAVTARIDAELLEARAIVDGKLDRDGYFVQSDESFFADLDGALAPASCLACSTTD